MPVNWSEDALKGLAELDSDPTMGIAPQIKMRRSKASKPQVGSLGAKLININVGEEIYLHDEAPPGKGATNMEKQVQTLIHRAPYLINRVYRTQRCDLIQESGSYSL